MLVSKNVHEGLYPNLKMTELDTTQHFLGPLSLVPLNEDLYLICEIQSMEAYCVKLSGKISSYIISSNLQKIQL